ncbi:MAG: ABC transporter permease [Euryarchaeota archaeon]|nr:ABC transporter permease [Euryarchaeota archaeon]
MVLRTELQAMYIIWFREMRHFVRAKSRIVASIVQPFFFLFILGFGLNRASFPGLQGNYIHFIAPGIVAMAIMFSSVATGVSVLWDRQFGFLQEVLVAPVSRLSIIVGRTLGGATISLVQGFIILVVALAFGVNITGGIGLLLTILFMILVSFASVGFGLIIASKIQDFQGFQIIINLILLPLFFVSSAFFPVNEYLPSWLTTISFLNPMFYMVDGLRGSLTGVNNVFPLVVDFAIVGVICLIMMGLGAYFFNKSEV